MTHSITETDFNTYCSDGVIQVNFSDAITVSHYCNAQHKACIDGNCCGIQCPTYGCSNSVSFNCTDLSCIGQTTTTTTTVSSTTTTTIPVTSCELNITEANPPQDTKTGNTANATVNVTSIGGPCYGLVICSFNDSKDVHYANETCTLIDADSFHVFYPGLIVSKEGTWNVTSCSVYNSSSVNCSTITLQDEYENVGTFNVYTPTTSPTTTVGGGGGGSGGGGGRRMTTSTTTTSTITTSTVELTTTTTTIPSEEITETTVEETVQPTVSPLTGLVTSVTSNVGLAVIIVILVIILFIIHRRRARR
jgi:hypothetical protein